MHLSFFLSDIHWLPSGIKYHSLGIFKVFFFLAISTWYFMTIYHWSFHRQKQDIFAQIPKFPRFCLRSGYLGCCCWCCWWSLSIVSYGSNWLGNFEGFFILLLSTWYCICGHYWSFLVQKHDIFAKIRKFTTFLPKIENSRHFCQKIENSLEFFTLDLKTLRIQGKRIHIRIRWYQAFHCFIWEYLVS